MITNADEKYASINYTSRLSDDGQSTIINCNSTFFVDLLQVQQRTNATLKRDPLDEKYSVQVLATTIDTCKLGKGVQTTFLQKTYMATFAQSANFKIVCPFPKNQQIIISNLSLTDALLPPMPIEKKFKVRTKTFAKIIGKKGWTFIFENIWYGSYKK